MAGRRSVPKPNIEMSFWKKEGDLWYVDPIQFADELTYGPRDLEEIKKRMGVGYRHIEDLLSGKGIDVWAASYVEYGLRPDRTFQFHTSPPNESHSIA